VEIFGGWEIFRVTAIFPLFLGRVEKVENVKKCVRPRPKARVTPDGIPTREISLRVFFQVSLF